MSLVEIGVVVIWASCLLWLVGIFVYAVGGAIHEIYLCRKLLAEISRDRGNSLISDGRCQADCRTSPRPPHTRN
jgi:hypothetical protein